MTEKPSIYQQEIEELRELYSQELFDLRAGLEAAGFAPEQLVLVAFFEDEKKNKEYGVLVTRELRVYEYVRSTSARAGVGAINLQDITYLGEKWSLYPQIRAAMDMAAAGRLF